MNTATTKPKTEGTKMLQVMGGLGALCALLIVLTYEGTAPRIAQLKEEALQQAVFSVLPGTQSTQEFYLSDQSFGTTPVDNSTLIFAGYDADGELIGVAIEASGRGYADIIKVLYGYDPINEQIIGFYVLESKETPGLGDKIEKDAGFQSNFSAMDVALDADGSALKYPVTTVKHGEKTASWQIDGITGATISSRAIGAMLDASTTKWLPVIQKNLNTLQTTPAP